MDSNGNCPPQMSGLGADAIISASEQNVADGCPPASTSGPAGHATASDGDMGGVPLTDHAPLELLAALLTSVTEKDYETAHKQCREILDYEPSNVTAHRFLLLISERIQLNAEEDESEEDDDDESCSDEESDSSSDDESSTSDGTRDSEKESDQPEEDDETTASSYGTDDDVASEDGLADETAYDEHADGNVYEGNEAGQAFESTSSDAMLSTGQSSGEAIDRLRAKVVPGKVNLEKQ